MNTKCDFPKVNNTYTVDRQANYDFLRVVCTIAVVVIHVSARYFHAITNPLEPYRTHMAVTLIYYTLSKFAVACFMMLSGALLINNNKNGNYKYFYRKSFINIGIPTIIFSILYFLFSILQTRTKSGIKSSIVNLLKGQPYPHMWYMYTLIGVYLFIPILIRLKDDIGECCFAKVCWIYFIFASVCAWTSSSLFFWSISKSICYVGFAMIGYQIRRITARKNNKKGLLFILVSLLTALILTYIVYYYINQGINVPEAGTLTIYGTAHYSPLVVLSAIFLFVGFSFLSIQCNKIETLSKDTFLIYLLHYGILEIYNKILSRFVGEMLDPMVAIPVSTVIILFLSWVCAFFYKKIWRLVNKNNRVTDFMCRIVRLN